MLILDKNIHTRLKSSLRDEGGSGAKRRDLRPSFCINISNLQFTPHLFQDNIVHLYFTSGKLQVYKPQIPS